jgi:hypothetical protein
LAAIGKPSVRNRLFWVIAMLSETRDISGTLTSPALSNLLVSALLEKQAAQIAEENFSGYSSIEVEDIASNPAGLYSRERSWMAVEYLCAQALARALEVQPSDKPAH